MTENVIRIVFLNISSYRAENTRYMGYK